MKFLTVFLLLCLAAPVNAGDRCEDAWFTRNQIMNQAGYCFGSALGQALFDNSDCVGKQVQPDPAHQPIVAQIRAVEAELSCRVDTSRTNLDLPDINFRRVLTDHPVRVEFEGGCVGWTAPLTPLYAGHSDPLLAIGQIEPGSFVLYSHQPVGDWAYVTVYTPEGSLISAGWLHWPGDEDVCTDHTG